jgi:Transposase DDE domain
MPQFPRRASLAFDATDYRNRNVVERGFCTVKQWRGLATRYDKLALTFTAARPSKRSSPGDAPWETCLVAAAVNLGAGELRLCHHGHHHNNQ